MAVARVQGRRRLPASMLLLAVSILVFASIAFIQWQQPGPRRLSTYTSRAGQHLKSGGASIESRLVSEAAEGFDQGVGKQLEHEQQQQPAHDEEGERERISGGGGAQEVGPADISHDILVQSEVADVKGDATSMSDVEEGRHAQYGGPPPPPPPPPPGGNKENSIVSFAGRSVHVCKGRGDMNLSTEIAEHIFPDMLLIKPANYSRAKSTDLLITNGKCPIRVRIASPLFTIISMDSVFVFASVSVSPSLYLPLSVSLSVSLSLSLSIHVYIYVSIYIYTYIYIYICIFIPAHLEACGTSK